MNLSEKIPMIAEGFADGAKGWAMQQYGNKELGVHRIAERENRDSAFVVIWTIDTIPGKTFKTYAELREAAKEMK